MDQRHFRNGWPFICRSAKSRSWEKAEDLKRRLGEEYDEKPDSELLSKLRQMTAPHSSPEN
jgi:hypothetical protein